MRNDSINDNGGPGNGRQRPENERRTVARAAARGRALAGLLLLGACDAAPEMIGPESALLSLSSHANGATTMASGGGHFFGQAFPGVPVQFAFTAIQRNATTGEADGRYHFSSVVGGLAIEIHGRITCLTVDPANPGRAWMGGVITQNESEHPLYTGATSQVGRDSWFRVVDYGEGSNASQPDRSTLVFVEPTGGFTSARAFCDSKLWFPDDRLTNPVVSGNIQVRH
jgi:hypothetical protein